MTGQVDFDSHTSGTVLAAVAAINVVSPGWEHGRPYTPPTGEALRAALLEALRLSSRNPEQTVPAEHVAEFSGYLDELRNAFVLLEAGVLDDACELVNRLLIDTQATPMLARHDGEAWHLHFHHRDAPWAKGWAGPMATAIAMVLGSPSFDRLGLCSAPGCDRAYVDTSRNGTRRFCSTACQNRVKAATFRERQRANVDQATT